MQTCITTCLGCAYNCIGIPEKKEHGKIAEKIAEEKNEFAENNPKFNILGKEF